MWGQPCFVPTGGFCCWVCRILSCYWKRRCHWQGAELQLPFESGRGSPIQGWWGQNQDHEGQRAEGGSGKGQREWGLGANEDGAAEGKGGSGGQDAQLGTRLAGANAS